MMQAVSIALAAAAWAAVAYRATRPGQSLLKPALTPAGPTDAHNLRCIVLTAVVATLYVPSVAQWIDAGVGIAGVATTMLLALLVIGAGELLMALRCVSSPPERLRTGRTRRGLGVAAVITVMVVALVVGRPEQGDVTVLWGAGSAPAWMALYWGSWLVWCGYAGARALWIAGGYARGGPDRIVRQALLLLAVGAAALVFYAAVKATAIAVVVSGGVIPTPLMAATKMAVVVMGLSAVATSAWPATARAYRRRRIARQLAQVTPLWLRLRPVGPQLVLEMPGHGADDAQVRLWRMCVEVVDWWVLLAQHLAPESWPAALAAAPGHGADRMAVAAAGWTEAALRVHAAVSVPAYAGGRGGGTGHRAPPPTPAGSAALQRFVLAVARVPPSEAARVAAAVAEEGV